MNIPKSSPQRRAAQSRGPSRAGQPRGEYLLRLFVAGATARSSQAVLRVRELCASELNGGGKLEVIDIYQQPELARTHQIIATPTLIMEFPRPVRRFIGSLVDTPGLHVELTAGTKANIAL